MTAQPDLQNIEAEIDKILGKPNEMMTSWQIESLVKTKAAIKQLCSSRELAGRIDEVERAMKKRTSIKVKSGYAGLAMQEFTTGLFNAVPIAKLEQRLAALKKEK